MTDKSNAMKARLTTGVIFVWASFLTCAMATLMAGHWVSLPHPEKGSVLKGTEGQVVESVNVFHFLYGDCTCSRRILQQLLSREVIQGASERIVLIGEDDDAERLASEKGFAVSVVTPTQLKQQYDVESAPLLIVASDAGSILYSGGYTSRKQGLDNQDLQIIQSIQDGKQYTELPVYGCAVSQRLKDLIDPLKLK